MDSQSIKIVDYPPEGIYEKCQELWGVDFDRGTVFTYGTTIHAKQPMTDDLLVHEKTHVRQQTEMDKDDWWRKYFSDAQFRFDQELEAYKAQYKWVEKNIKDRNIKARLLVHYANSLSGEMYGNIVSKEEALKVIKQDAK